MEELPLPFKGPIGATRRPRLSTYPWMRIVAPTATFMWMNQWSAHATGRALCEPAGVYCLQPWLS